ncbi:MAG TPA: hypothetical protein VGJ81_07365 [Thermoanaerobaculia bacterium]|jgi:hypothetical protein
MRRFFSTLALCTLIALPALAQNTDIEALSGLLKFLNAPADPLGITAEECLQLKRLSRWRGGALVFYVETGDSETPGQPGSDH